MQTSKFRCVGYKKDERLFTVGKLYEVNDGSITNDNGHTYSGWGGNDGAIEYLSFWYKFEKVEESKMFTNKDIRSADRVYTNSGCGIAIAFGDELIVNYTDHSGWDDARSVTINKVVRPTIPYHMTKDGNCEGKVVYDRKARIGCEPVHRFSAGDRVSVAKMGQIYSGYKEFVDKNAHDYLNNYIEQGHPNDGVILTVIAHKEHPYNGDYLYIVQDKTTHQVFVFGEGGLEKA